MHVKLIVEQKLFSSSFSPSKGDRIDIILTESTKCVCFFLKYTCEKRITCFYFSAIATNSFITIA